MEESDMVRLTAVESDVDANYIKNALAEENIQVVLAGHEASALGMGLDGPDQIELFVKKDELDKATKFVEELMDDDAEPIPAWTCKCGEEVDEGFGICWSCGAEFEGESE